MQSLMSKMNETYVQLVRGDLKPHKVSMNKNSFAEYARSLPELCLPPVYMGIEIEIDDSCPSVRIENPESSLLIN